jgi:vacuolar-type H+-ATPase subunit F/Vma7
MRTPVRIVCRRPAALGIALAGVAPVEAASGEQAAAALGGARLVLMEQALYDALPVATKRQLRREGVPVVMPFPGPALVPGVAPEQELLEVLRRAVGYRLRLK